MKLGIYGTQIYVAVAAIHLENVAVWGAFRFYMQIVLCPRS